MTKVLKLLGGGWLAAVLGIVMLSAAMGIFNYDGGPTPASVTIDQASAQAVIGDDAMPAGNASAAVLSAPSVLPAVIDNPAYDATNSVSIPFALNDPGGGIVNLNQFASGLMHAYVSNPLNQLAEPSNQLNTASGDGTNTSGFYSLNLRWSPMTWVGVDSGVTEVIKGTGITASPEDTSLYTRVTAIVSYDAATKSFISYFPSGVNVPGANTVVTLSAGHAYWMATSNQTGAHGLDISSIVWADAVDYSVLATQSAGGQTVQTADLVVSPADVTLASGSGVNNSLAGSLASSLSEGKAWAISTASALAQRLESGSANILSATGVNEMSGANLLFALLGLGAVAFGVLGTSYARYSERKLAMMPAYSRYAV